MTRTSGGASPNISKAVNADLDLLGIMLRDAANEMNYLSNNDASRLTSGVG